MMGDEKPTYQELEARLTAAENILKGLRSEKIDALVGQKGVYLLRLRQAEEELRRSESRMMGVFRAAPIGIGVVNDRVIQDVNEYFCKLSGHSRDELIGKNARILYPTDADYEFVGSEKYRQIEVSGTGSVETRMLRKDGRVIDVLISSTPIDPNDLSLGVTFTVLDITERKRTEEALKAERKMLETVLRQLPEGVIVAEAPSGKLILGNAQVDKIWRHNFTASQNVDDYHSYRGFHPDGRPYHPNDWPLARTIRSGETVERQEIKFQRGDGSFGWMSASSAPIRDEDGNVVAGVVTFSDTTRAKEVEEMRRRYRKELEREVGNRTAAIEAQYKELQELNTLIKQLSWKTIDALETERKALSKEIHDSIAGTLAAIKMQLEAYLKQTAQGISSNPMSLEAIVGHLTGAIKETKHISMQLRSTTLDDFGLQPAIEEHIRHFRQFYPDIEVVSRIDIENMNIPSKTETVLYRVVQEALNNIGKHSAATVARLELKNLQKQFQLKISDNGRGFDLQPVLSERDSLTGFGIHSMRERVEICEGTFQIRSKPNQGTVIDISIPI